MIVVEPRVGGGPSCCGNCVVEMAVLVVTVVLPRTERFSGFSAVGVQRHKGRLNVFFFAKRLADNARVLQGKCRFLAVLALPMIPCANRRKSIEANGYKADGCVG